MLDLIRVTLCTSFLIYSSWSDWRMRRVTNKLWILMVSAGIILLFYDFCCVPWVIFSVAFISILMYLLFRMHAFGGADAKFFISLSVLFPFYPELGIGIPRGLISIFAFSVLLNTIIIIILFLACLFLYNKCKVKASELPAFLFITIGFFIAVFYGDFIK